MIRKYYLISLLNNRLFSNAFKGKMSNWNNFICKYIYKKSYLLLLTLIMIIL